MKKRQELIKLIKNIWVLLAGIQVVLGLIWVACNITKVPCFAESRLYLQASKDFVIDEYMGILYPVLIRVASVLGSNWCGMIYFVQLGLAFGAYYTLLRNVFGHLLAPNQRKILYFMAAYVITFPVILQCHMSILPYSAASSLLIFTVSQLKSLLSKEGPMSKPCVISIGVFWGLAALLLPDYGVIIGVPVLVGFFMYGWKRERRWKVLLLTLFITVACTGSVLALTQTPGSLGRIQKTMGATMLSRFAWPYMERNSFFWSEEVKETFDTTDFAQFSLYPERIMYEFGPRLELALGKEQANTLYWQMAKDSFLIGKKDALWAIGRDILINIAGPIGIQIQWMGKGISYAGWNYGRLLEYTPALTGYYVSFAKYSFDFMLLMMLTVCLLLKGSRKAALLDKFYWLVLLVIGVMTIWSTMTGNGMQDYLKVVPINVCWCLLPVWGCTMCIKNTKEKKV